MAVPPEIAALIEPALLARDGSRHGNEIAYRCAHHDDDKPSASFNTTKGFFFCQACSAKGGYVLLAAKLNINLPKRPRGRPPKRPTIRATYDYNDEAGTLLYQTVRFDPKDFRQRRPDGNGGWIWNLDGVRRVLYHTQDLVDPTDAVVYVVEGEKDADRLRGEGLVATCNALGAGKWLPSYNDQLRGRRVVVIADNDDPGRKHAASVAAALFAIANSVGVLELPGVTQPGADVSDWLDSGNTIEALVALAGEAKALRRVSLADVRATFRTHLVGDPDLIITVLGTVAANRLQCDPVWLFVVGAPSSGKTERIMAAQSLPDVHLLNDLTVGGLLSGVSQKDRATNSKGGILREIGPYGLLLIKDFSTILSMPNDARNALIGAFREIFDGRYSRALGADGGKKLEWEGKLGIIAAVTEAIDQYHAVIGQLGERFLYYRCPPVARQEQARRSFANVGRGRAMRTALRDVVTQFFANLDLEHHNIEWKKDDATRIVNLADLASWLRSAIFRAGRNFEIELVPDPEAPARLAQQLAALFQGLLAIGASRSDSWRLLRKVALDCLPKLRRLTVELLVTTDNWMTTAQVAGRLNVPTNTVRRTLEDLAAHGVVDRDAARAKSETDEGDRRNDRWQLSTRARNLFTAIAPTKQEGGNGKTKCEGRAESPFNNFESTEGEFVGAVLGEDNDTGGWDA
jgi:hypothetical protein